jgi:hypothetical protein
LPKLELISNELFPILLLGLVAKCNETPTLSSPEPFF